jgi:dihydrofolate reductase
MGKIIYQMSISVDGYMAGPNGELDWQLVDDELHEHLNDQAADMRAFLNGRVMYELMAAFWPTADADPASTPPMVRFAGIWRDMPKIVYSRTLDRADWNTTIVRDVVPADIRAMAEQDGRDLGVGGADLAGSFMRHDLIDEYRLYVHPVVIGRGKPAFPTMDRRIDMRLVETRTFGTGVVLLRHQRPAD